MPIDETIHIRLDDICEEMGWGHDQHKDSTPCGPSAGKPIVRGRRPISVNLRPDGLLFLWRPGFSLRRGVDSGWVSVRRTGSSQPRATPGAENSQPFGLKTVRAPAQPGSDPAS
jgi:hypothetical protein